MNHRNLPPRTLAAALPHFISMLTGKLGLKVRWARGTRTAMTTLKEVVFEPFYLHRMADEGKLAQMCQLYFGKAWHEGGHHRHTDMVAMATWRAANPEIEALFMPLEDARMEAALIREFPGAEADLNVCFDTLTDFGLFGPIPPDAGARSLLHGYVLYRARAITRRQANCRKWADEARELLVEAFGKAFVVRLDVLLNTRMPQLRSSQEVCDLVEDIGTAIEEERRKLQQQAASASASQGNPGSAGDDSDQDADDDADEKGAQGSSDADQGDADEDEDAAGNQGDDTDDADADDEDDQGGSDAGQDDAEEEADATAGQDGDTGGDAAGEDSPQSKADALKEALTGQNDGAGDLDSAISQAVEEAIEHLGGDEDAVDAFEVGGDTSDADEMFKYSSRRVTVDFSEAMLASQELAGAIAAKLEALKREAALPGKRGRFNPRMLPRVPCGEERMFLQQSPRRGIDTAVFLLLDTSGSMCGHRIEVARAAVYATARAMTPIRGVSLAAGCFPVGGMLKTWSQPAFDPAPFGVSADGGSTPLAEGLLAARRELLPRREARKLLIVVTDGEPDSVSAAILEREVAEGLGIEVYGLGIQLPAVRNVFPRHDVIQKLDELAPSILGLIGQRLIDQAA